MKLISSLKRINLHPFQSIFVISITHKVIAHIVLNNVTATLLRNNNEFQFKTSCSPSVACCNQRAECWQHYRQACKCSLRSRPLQRWWGSNGRPMGREIDRPGPAGPSRNKRPNEKTNTDFYFLNQVLGNRKERGHCSVKLGPSYTECLWCCLWCCLC